MRREHHPAASIVEHAAGDKEPQKPAITEARREQNRRAQKAFRERRRAKKQIPTSTTLRQLAPHPAGVRPDVIVRHPKTEILVRTQNTSNQETLRPTNSEDVSINERQNESKPHLCTAEALFTFSSAQTLFPAEEWCLVPKPSTPFSQFLKFTRDHPRAALWPHGATATLAACLFNGQALGIDIERVMDPHYMSPFYRPSNSLALPEEAAVQPTTLDISSDSHLAVFEPLRPCFAQVSFPHHACIDLLPLPRLREMAVLLLVRGQQEGGERMTSAFDGVQELKKDVYVRQGIRFRGTGDLRGGERIASDENGRHCGHPWERASWAVSSWFATKWRFLMDV